MMMCIQNLVSFCQFVLKILSKNRILTSIKGINSVANLRKTKIYNNNIDIVNDNVYTKFGLHLFILSQDIEQKPNSDINQGPLLCCRGLVVVSGQIFNSSKLLCISSLSARMKMIQSKMNELEGSQHFSHYKSMGFFFKTLKGS